MIGEWKAHILSNAEILKETAFVSENQTDTQSLLREFVRGEFHGVALEEFIKSSKWFLQTGCGRQEVAFSAAGKSSYRPVIAGVNAPRHVIDDHGLGRMRVCNGNLPHLNHRFGELARLWHSHMR